MHAQLAAAIVTVRVPLHADGDLADGARRIVDRTDAADRLEGVTVRDISPGLNDITVELEVHLAVDEDDRITRLRRDLETGTGIVAVESIDRRSVPTTG